MTKPLESRIVNVYAANNLVAIVEIKFDDLLLETSIVEGELDRLTTRLAESVADDLNSAKEN